MPMKTILFIIFLCSVAIESIALPKEGDSKEMDTFPKAEKRVKNLKQIMDLQGAIQLPFKYPGVINDNKKIYGLNGYEITTCIPRYVYQDLGRKIRRIPKGNQNSVDYILFRHFDIKQKNFALMLLSLESVPMEFRDFLVTVDTNYQMIDTLEVGIQGTHKDRIMTKQYQLHADLSFFVYDLQPTSEKIQLYETDFLDSFDAQRVDTHYQINDEGKFIKKKEIRYKPKTYTLEELYQKSIHGIWNGTETPLDTH
jgi:hypothetical protein